MKNKRKDDGSALEQELLTLFRRLNAYFLPFRGYCSCFWLPPLPAYQDTSSSWFFDFGASFHMTLDSTQLSSLSSVDHPLVGQAADGTSHPVIGRGVLSMPSFHMPSISHVHNLTMLLMSAGQITDHECRIILESDPCCV